MHRHFLARTTPIETVVAGTAAVLAILWISFLGAPVNAATPTQGGGQALEIGPPVLNLLTDPGKTVTASISLRDISSTSLVVTNEVNDFTANGEDGTPKVILDPTQSSPYSFKTWITPIPALTLKPHDVKSIPVSIAVPANASPGGYYGIIRFTGTAPSLNGTGVALNASLGALVFLRVNGAVSESMNIEEFSVNNGSKPQTLFETTPVTFVERLKDTGNIYEQPTGLVTVTDMFNHKVATLPVNAEQHTILPGTIRRFQEPLDNTVIGNKLLFGRYGAHLNITYGANNQTLTKDFSFWIIPYRLIIFAVIFIVIGVTLLIFLIRRYNKHIINRAQKKK